LSKDLGQNTYKSDKRDMELANAIIPNSKPFYEEFQPLVNVQES